MAGGMRGLAGMFAASGLERLVEFAASRVSRGLEMVRGFPPLLRKDGAPRFGVGRATIRQIPSLRLTSGFAIVGELPPRGK